MSDHPEVEIEFPCDHMFKAFAATDRKGDFHADVAAAVNSVVACSEDALKDRSSSGGKYVCVTALVHLHSREQMDDIYRALKKIDGLLYLL